MLSTDSIILNILQTAKSNGDSLLEDFHISYPSEQVAEEANSIFVAVMSAENNIDGFDFQTFTDLVEILIVTKQRDYEDAIIVIKTVIKHICDLLLKNTDKFPTKPVIRNINPEFNRDYVLTRGHIMVQVKTDPITFELTEDEYTLCKLILKDDVITNE